MIARPKIDMQEATRLTRAGRLGEAMALLRGAVASPPPSPPASETNSAEMPGPGGRTIIDMVPPSPGTGETWTPPQPGDPAAAPAGRPQAREAFRGFLDRFRRPHAPAGDTVAPGRPAAPGAAPAPDGARFDECSYAGQTGRRTYKLYIPGGRAEQALPLVVMLHGCTQSPDDFAAGTRMNELAEEQGFLVAYPEQTRSANASRCWNWFNPGDQRRDGGEPALIAGITRQIMRDHPVDPRRVYVAGLSAGGAAAAIMGAAYPDLYAAVGVHSGLACGAASDMMSAFTAMRQGMPPAAASLRRSGAAVPTIVFHGDRDTTVSPVNGDQVLAQAEAVSDLRTTVRNGTAPGGIGYTCTIRADDAGRPMSEHWVLHGAGHAWSGGSPAGSYTEPRGPDASREMMRFFRRQLGE
ncbi:MULTISPECIES: extracellular catalytic domain type 1 short-chain-length polyhydroxyalkanoate depolymerase [unclassified Inquilinus]|uniref:extracellular catalytic domain type 1 short-chain-length polyhydroxyalkanoate depolymerase n=1 Tax=unclassified Inquilinus TaxID=2645927 RepID=UPI003F915201